MPVRISLVNSEIKPNYVGIFKVIIQDSSHPKYVLHVFVLYLYLGLLKRAFIARDS